MTFLGARADARALMARADLLLVTSDSEGQSIAVLEALSAGTPVVSTPVPGMRDLLGGGAGVIVADFTPEALAAAVRELLADPARRTRHGSRGRGARARALFGRSRWWSAYERRYVAARPYHLVDNAARRAPAILKKRRFGVMFVVMLTVGFAAALALVTPPRYEATATLAITPKSNENQALIGAGDLSALLSTYAETAKSRVNRARAQQILGRPLPGEVDTSTVGGTGILRITGNAATPQDAADTANAAAQGFQQSLEANPLIVVSVINPPEPPTSAVQPRPPLIVAVGILLGLLAGHLLRARDGARAPPAGDAGGDQRDHRQAGRRPAAAPARAAARAGRRSCGTRSG